MIKNQMGSSLVQAMVGLAIMGVTSVVFMNMMGQMSTSQRMAMDRQDITSLTLEMQSMFSSPNICRSGIVPGTTFDMARASSTYPPPSGTAVTGLPFRYQINGDMLASQGTLSNYGVNSSKVLMVNAGVAGTDTSGNPVYRADIIAEFAPKSGSNTFGIRNLVSGYFTVNAGSISGCGGSSPPTREQASLNCALLGGNYDTGTSACSLRAEMPAANLTCAALGGTFTNGKCSFTDHPSAVTASTSQGGSGSVQTSGMPDPATFCGSLGGTWGSGKCTLPSSATTTVVAAPPATGSWRIVSQGNSACQGAAPRTACTVGMVLNILGRTGGIGAPCNNLYQCM